MYTVQYKALIGEEWHWVTAYEEVSLAKAMRAAYTLECYANEVRIVTPDQVTIKR